METGGVVDLDPRARAAQTVPGPLSCWLYRVELCGLGTVMAPSSAAQAGSHAHWAEGLATPGCGLDPFPGM